MVITCKHSIKVVVRWFVGHTTHFIFLVINVLPKPFHLHAGNMGHRRVEPLAYRAVCFLDHTKILWPVLLGRILAVELPHLLKGMELEPFLSIDALVDIGLQDD